MDQNYQTQQKFEKCKNFSGFLNKKSPQAFVGFQRRYFMIKDNGKYLAYFKKQPQQGEQPAGVILIQEIEILEELDSFIVKYANRDFILKAGSQEMQVEWIDCLKFLKQYQKNGIKSEKQNEFLSTWKYEDLDIQTRYRIQTEVEQQTSDFDLNTQEIEEQNISIQKQLKIYPIFQTLQPDQVNFGFLLKKKLNFPHKLQKPKQRWLFFVSNLNQNELGKFSPPIETNIIYYYDYSNQKEVKYLGQIKISDIIQIEQYEIQLDSNKIKNGITGLVNLFGFDIGNYKYGFYIKVLKQNQEIQYDFYSQYIIQTEKWVKQISKIMLEIHKQDNQESKVQKEQTIQNKNDKNQQQTQKVLNNLSNQTENNAVKNTQIILKDKLFVSECIDPPVWRSLQVLLTRKEIKYENEKIQTVLLNSIKQCERQEGNDVIFIIKNNEKASILFKCQSKQYRDVWIKAIKVLKENPNSKMEEFIQFEYDFNKKQETMNHYNQNLNTSSLNFKEKNFNNNRRNSQRSCLQYIYCCSCLQQNYNSEEEEEKEFELNQKLTN